MISDFGSADVCGTAWNPDFDLADDAVAKNTKIRRCLNHYYAAYSH